MRKTRSPSASRIDCICMFIRRSGIREQRPWFDFDFVQMRGRDSSGKIEDLDPDDHAFAAVVENNPGCDFLALRDKTFIEREVQRVSFFVDAQFHEMLLSDSAVALASPPVPNFGPDFRNGVWGHVSGLCLRHPRTEEVLQALLEILGLKPVTGVAIRRAPVDLRAVGRVIEQATTNEKGQDFTSFSRTQHLERFFDFLKSHGLRCW